jgi:hypothetical protein
MSFWELLCIILHENWFQDNLGCPCWDNLLILLQLIDHSYFFDNGCFMCALLGQMVYYNCTMWICFFSNVQ